MPRFNLFPEERENISDITIRLSSLLSLHIQYSQSRKAEVDARRFEAGRTKWEKRAFFLQWAPHNLGFELSFLPCVTNYKQGHHCVSCASVSAKDSGLSVADYCPKITEVKEGKGCMSSPSTAELSLAAHCLVLCADGFSELCSLDKSLETSFLFKKISAHNHPKL